MPFDPSPTYPLVEPNRTELEPWRQVLMDAAGIVRKGWCQGLARDSDEDGDRFCAMGALFKAAANDFALFQSAGAHLDQFAMDHGFAHDEHFRPAALWNDVPGRTAEEVASTMERVALSGRRE